MQIFKSLALSCLLVGSLQAGTITIGRDAYDLAKNYFPKMKLVSSTDEIAVVEMLDYELPRLSDFMHQHFNRCGGFMYHEDHSEALSFLEPERFTMDHANFLLDVDYTLSKSTVVKPLVAQADDIRLFNTIQKLSSYQNRFYKSQTGIKASDDIRDMWKAIGKDRSDFTVEQFTHSSYPQKSVIVTIKGSETPEDVIIVGGHLDSIAGYWGQNNSAAPGADDNASGIATITEIMRVLVENNYRPSKTIKFIGYAAEEVGLLGSKDIATKFKKDRVNVVGVLQLDMTAYKGSEKDIYFMSDFSSDSQNKFLQSLTDAYVGASWGVSRCGYGCSDHASWTSQGYPASIPFEADMETHNQHIHTAKDTVQIFQDAKHAVKFAKLGIAYVVELDK